MVNVVNKMEDCIVKFWIYGFKTSNKITDYTKVWNEDNYSKNGKKNGVKFCILLQVAI